MTWTVAILNTAGSTSLVLPMLMIIWILVYYKLA